MKKKIFLLGAVIVLMLSFTITASADELFSLDCTGMADKRNGSEWNDNYNSDYAYYEVINETIHMYGTMEPDGTKVTESMKIPFNVSIEGEALIYYDIMFPSGEADCKSGVSMQFFLGGNRATLGHSPSAFPQVGEWYNVMVHIDADQKTAYYRVKLATASEWGARTNASIASNSGASGFKAYIQPSGEKDTTHKAEVYFDNIRVIQNLYIDDLKFMLDDTEITSVADITSEGTAKAAFNAANYDLDFNSDSVAPDVTQFTPMVVAFDKEGMMLDCAIYNDVEIGIYDNPGLEFGLDISSFVEQLDGGTIRLYIWDSMDNMEAMFDEFVLPATAE